MKKLRLTHQPTSSFSCHVTVDINVAVINVHPVYTAVHLSRSQYVRTITNNSLQQSCITIVSTPLTRIAWDYYFTGLVKRCSRPSVSTLFVCQSVRLSIPVSSIYSKSEIQTNFKCGGVLTLDTN